MTFETLTEAIRRLIVKRAEAHEDFAEQKRITEKLERLYDLKYLMLQQQGWCNE